MVWTVCTNISLNEREGFKFRIVAAYKADQVDSFIFLKLSKMNIKDRKNRKIKKKYPLCFCFHLNEIEEKNEQSCRDDMFLELTMQRQFFLQSLRNPSCWVLVSVCVNCMKLHLVILISLSKITPNEKSTESNNSEEKPQKYKYASMLQHPILNV